MIFKGKPYEVVNGNKEGRAIVIFDNQGIYETHNEGYISRLKNAGYGETLKIENKETDIDVDHFVDVGKMVQEITADDGVPIKKGNFKCKECGEYFGNIGLLQRHKKTHRG